MEAKTSQQEIGLPQDFQLDVQLPNKYRCPICGGKLVVKHRFNPEITDLHQPKPLVTLHTTGILIACDNWQAAKEGKCYSLQSKGSRRSMPWHTWIDPWKLDLLRIDRGGKKMLEDLGKEFPEIRRDIEVLRQRYKRALQREVLIATKGNAKTFRIRATDKEA
jgi:hypothetical protein